MHNNQIVFALFESGRDLQYTFEQKIPEVVDANYPNKKDELDKLVSTFNEKMKQDPELVDLFATFLALDRVMENRVYYHVDSRFMDKSGRSPQSGYRITSPKNLEEETQFSLVGSRNFP